MVQKRSTFRFLKLAPPDYGSRRQLNGSDDQGASTYRKAPDDSVRNITNTRLQRQQVRREASLLDFVLKELDEMPCNRARRVIRGSVVLCLIRVVRLDDGHHTLGVDGDVRGANSVFGGHDKIGFATRRKVGHRNVVEAFQGRHGGIHFDDNLSGRRR